MRVAVLSDPHGDFVALRKVIQDIDAYGHVDEVLVGGDLAQGGAQPSEVVDELRQRGWRSVRGNGDDLLVRIADGWADRAALRPGEPAHGKLPDGVAAVARESVRQLGPERIDYLRSLPTALELGPCAAGRLVLVHATPWSTEDVVLPDADPEMARRMVDEADARLLLYGHIHTAYQRRINDSVLASVGAVSGSNDQDPRPAYMIVGAADVITIEVRRVDWTREQRHRDYEAAGVPARFIRDQPGPLPVRSQAGIEVQVWP